MKKLFKDERAQGMTEYLVLVAIIALGVTFMTTRLPKAIGRYTEPFFYTFSRSVP